MSIDQHGADAPGHEDAVAHHRTDDHGEDHGHDDHAHGEEEEALGPIDPFAWGAGILGVGVAIAIAVCLAVATSVG
jgi:ABC-type Zn2+ transport system substrate-binding protein/surface adhesin